MDALRRVAGLVGLLVLGLATPGSALIFVVNQIADTAATDSAPGDGNCDVNPQTVEKECSLRVAIHEANKVVGPDVIKFSISGSDHRINLENGKLPAIKGPVTIDGTTEPDFANNGGRPVVLIDGNQSIPSFGVGLKIVGPAANGTVIRGLAFDGFGGNLNEEGAAVSLQDAAGVVIENCFFGVLPTGAGGLGDFIGVFILRGTSNKVRANTIASSFIGVEIAGADSTNVNQNNFGFHGQTLLPNFDGIVIRGETTPPLAFKTATKTKVHDNFIIGSSDVGIIVSNGSRLANIKSNLILGNRTGVRINSTTESNTLSNNTIEDNTQDGVLLIDAAFQTVKNNVIWKNDRHGISILRGGLNLILSNFIGTDPTATQEGGNEVHGITVKDSESNVIGARDRGNVMAFNILDNLNVTGRSEDNRIHGNVIRESALGNGITFRNKARRNRVGGPLSNSTSEAPNLITLNAGHGVLVRGEAQENALSTNSILSNGLSGIDLEAPDKLAEVTPNDPRDEDTGPNGLQNFPDFTLNEGQAVGKLKSEPNTRYRIEFFANATCHNIRNGEGETFLGSKDVTTDANGKAAFDVTLQIPQGKPVITVTATEDDGGELRSTSEFSACQPPPPPPPA